MAGLLAQATDKDWIEQLSQAGTLAASGAIVVGSLVVYLFTRFVLMRVLHAAAKRTRTEWDDALLHHGVPGRLSLVPALTVLFVGIAVTPDLEGGGFEAVRRVAGAGIVLSVALATSSVLSAANERYMLLPRAADRPIKSYLQVVKLLVFMLAGVLGVSIVLDRSPLLLLSGIGALTAVLLLVFKDTILSLVASVQLTANDLVNVGDWIEMPSHGADGEVTDIALHVVKVQNWDKTVTTIPTYDLISKSFKNWRFMSESGGRRIKRSVHIDVQAVRFLTADEVATYREFPLLTDYIAAKEAELDTAGGGHDPDAALTKGARRLTNLGIYRAYIEAYVSSHPDIHTEGMTLLTRQLPSGPQGIPIEIYCFTTTTDWKPYEAIQADLFDHLIAAMTRFDLRPFQYGSGSAVEVT